MRLGVLLLATTAACDPGSEFFEPAVFYVEGTFGYDAIADAAVAYVGDGGAVSPTVAITIASTEWFETYDDLDRCVVALRHLADTPLPRASWVAEAPDTWFGFDAPTDAEVTSDCAGWDPEVWGDDPATAVATWGWGLGIGALDDAVSDEVRDAVIASDGEATWDDEWQPAVFGGGFRWSGAADRFDGGFAPNGYAFGLYVDADFALVVQDDALLGIPATDVVDGAPPNGAYVIEQWFGIDAVLLAPTNL